MKRSKKAVKYVACACALALLLPLWTSCQQDVYNRAETPVNDGAGTQIAPTVGDLPDTPGPGESADEEYDWSALTAAGFSVEGLKAFDARVPFEGPGPIQEDVPWLIALLEKDLDANWSQLFAPYNGEALQLIVQGYQSPAQSDDVVFYRAGPDETPQQAVTAMIEAVLQSLMEPLMEPSDERSLTVTAYSVDVEQELFPIREDVWLLPAINGYYCYDGFDLVTMEERLKEEVLEQRWAQEEAEQRGEDIVIEDWPDGLAPFMRQGSASVYIFILLEEDGVYRLQRVDALIKMLDQAA